MYGCNHCLLVVIGQVLKVPHNTESSKAIQACNNSSQRLTQDSGSALACSKQCTKQLSPMRCCASDTVNDFAAGRAGCMLAEALACSKHAACARQQSRVAVFPPDVGSSRNSTDGAPRMPAAMDSRRLSPPDRPRRLRPPGSVPPTFSSRKSDVTLAEQNLYATKQSLPQQTVLRLAELKHEPSAIPGALNRCHGTLKEQAKALDMCEAYDLTRVLAAFPRPTAPSTSVTLSLRDWWDQPCPSITPE